MATLEQNPETIQKIIDQVTGGDLIKFEEITGIKQDTMKKYRRGNLKIPEFKWLWLLHRSGVKSMNKEQERDLMLTTNITDISKWLKFKGKVIRKVKGVIWVESRKKWIVSLMVDGTRHFIGQFDDHEEAITARKNAEVEFKK